MRERHPTDCHEPLAYTPELGGVDARTLPRIFSNDTRCETCGQSG